VRLLWAAKLASELGDWVARLALAVLVLDRTGSAALTASVAALMMAPWLGLGQLATIADRRPYPRVMVSCDLARAAVYVALAWLPLPVPVLLAGAFLAATMTPPFEAARSACLQRVARAETYGEALALFSATHQAGLLLGYAAGGGVVAVVGACAALTGNAMTFLVSAVLVAGVRASSSARSLLVTPRSSTRPLAAVLRAVVAIASDVLLRRGLLVLLLACVPAMAAEGLAVVYAAPTPHRGPAWRR
jgi:hypothetical protein